MASELGHMSVVEYLVTRGAMIDARNKEGVSNMVLHRGRGKS